MGLAVGFIGAGNMAGAIINGIIASKADCSIFAYDTDARKSARFGAAVNAAGNLETLLSESDMVFFAVKPQVLESVLEATSELNADRLSAKVFVTMVAGVSTGFYRKKLGLPTLRVVRIMPNTPMMLGCGATAVCVTENVSAAQLDAVKSLIGGSSLIREINEEQMNAVISINGSSPAFIFAFARAVTEYGEANGIDRETALSLFAQTLVGSAKMLTDSGKAPEELIRMVTSPGGTTLAAMQVFEAGGYEKMIKEAMDACTKRAGELGR